MRFWSVLFLGSMLLFCLFPISGAFLDASDISETESGSSSSDIDPYDEPDLDYLNHAVDFSQDSAPEATVKIPFRLARLPMSESVLTGLAFQIYTSFLTFFMLLSNHVISTPEIVIDRVASGTCIILLVATFVNIVLEMKRYRSRISFLHSCDGLTSLHLGSRFLFLAIPLAILLILFFEDRSYADVVLIGINTLASLHFGRLTSGLFEKSFNAPRRRIRRALQIADHSKLSSGINGICLQRGEFLMLVTEALNKPDASMMSEILNCGNGHKIKRSEHLYAVNQALKRCNRDHKAILMHHVLTQFGRAGCKDGQQLINHYPMVSRIIETWNVFVGLRMFQEEFYFLPELLCHTMKLFIGHSNGIFIS